MSHSGSHPSTKLGTIRFLEKGFYIGAKICERSIEEVEARAIIVPIIQTVNDDEKDFRVAVERLVAERKENLEAPLEIIARAYDPCISCSVHLIKVKLL